MTDQLPIICYTAASGDHFIRPIMESLSDEFEVRYLAGDRVEWPQPCDILWCEWADEAAVQMTNAPKVCPIIIRLHSYEAFTPYPEQIKWENVDAIVYVAEHVRERVEREYKVGGVPAYVIPNGVDLEKFVPPDPDERTGRKIGWAGGISHKKGPELFAAVVQAVRAHDPEYTFHVAGEFQDERYEEYFRHALPPGSCTFYGKLAADEMPGFWQGMDYTLSTSPWESFQYVIAEGMACGCVPLVHWWPGADTVYPPYQLWSRPHEIMEILRDRSPADFREPSREWVRLLYNATERTADIRRLLKDVLATRPEPPTISCCMIVKGNEARFKAAVESVLPHVDEVVAMIDDRHGPYVEREARDLGIRVFPMNVKTYAACIDFSWARNWIAGKATGDWIFVLDADEVLETGPGLRRAVGDAHFLNHDAIAVDVKCYTDRGLAEEAKDVRVYRNNGEIRYRYPVHNQLIGHRRVLGTDLRLRSTYVGGLSGNGSRQQRSIPPLLALWDEATEEIKSATTPSEIAAAGDKRLHAAFFLTRMYAAGAMHDEVIQWAETLHGLDPDQEFTAPYWRWWSLSEWHAKGEELGWERCARGLEQWPGHPDLHHIKLAEAFFRWVRACQQGFVGVPMHSRQFLPKAEQAAALLGLPVDRGK